MSERIDRGMFLRTYMTMAKKGATALEIAKSLGIDKGSDKANAQFVSQKASNYRRELLAEATEKGLSEEQTAQLMSMLPKLSGRSRNESGKSLASALMEMLEKIDS